MAGLRWMGELTNPEMEWRPVDLGAVLKEAVTLTCCMEEYTGRQVDVQMQKIPWPVEAVYGDHELLVLAFRNLLDNALKFTQTEGRVEVHVREDGQWAVVEVADTGPGIPSEDLSYIFEELYRGSNARDIPGSGLGLALVKRIVTLHGGEVQVRSRVGHGTVITVRLPLSQTKGRVSK